MLQLEECTKAKEKRDQVVGLVARETLLKVKQNVLKLPSKKNINISILLWQHVSVLLDHLQANIQRYEVQSVPIMYFGIPYYSHGVHKIV